MALFIGSLSRDEKTSHKPTPDESAAFAAGYEAWGRWVADHSSALIDPGTPLGRTLRASRAGISPTENRIVAYVIVEAESHEDAARMFADHPHFAIMPGDSVEILECLPTPQSP